MTMTYFTNGKFGSGQAPEGFSTMTLDATGCPPGYALADALGVSLIPVITLYSQEDTSKDGPAWLAEISGGDVIEWIGANSLRDALDLMARWAPVATSSILSYLCDVLAGPDINSVIPRLIAGIRADDREGTISEIEDGILAARQEGRKAWMTEQASPATTPVQGANGLAAAEAARLAAVAAGPVTPAPARPAEEKEASG